MDLIGSYHPRNKISISPGMVGPVGDTLSGVRLRQSTPDMPMRYDMSYGDRMGSNVQDGYDSSFTSKGRQARVNEQGRLINRGFKHAHGVVFQDIRPTARDMTPIVGSLGRMDWKNEMARSYQAKVMGEQFLPLPGGYSGTGLPRGALVPRTLALGEATPQVLANALSNVEYVLCKKADGTFTISLKPKQESKK